MMFTCSFCKKERLSSAFEQFDTDGKPICEDCFGKQVHPSTPNGYLYHCAVVSQDDPDACQLSEFRWPAEVGPAGAVRVDRKKGMNRKALWSKYFFLTKAQIRKMIAGII